MEYIAWYLLYATPCFFVAYCNGIHLHDRAGGSDSPDAQQRFLPYYRNLYSQDLRMLMHDYFGVYCPWSWKVARKHRLVDMRQNLGVHGKHHAVLGHITVIDCLNPQRQEKIARHTFISRKIFWSRSFCYFLVSPLSGTILIGVLIFWGIKESLGLFGIRA